MCKLLATSNITQIHCIVKRKNATCTSSINIKVTFPDIAKIGKFIFFVIIPYTIATKHLSSSQYLLEVKNHYRYNNFLKMFHLQQEQDTEVTNCTLSSVWLVF